MSLARTALKTWLFIVACLRLFAVYLGVFNTADLKRGLFPLSPSSVTDLYGRTFATWTVLTCSLCVICALNLSSKPIYLATLLSFVYAAVHLGTEAFVFKTCSLASAASPVTIAVTTSTWMAIGWKHYLSPEPSPKRSTSKKSF
mmetsp:Transcript_7882/g.13532  ORF Transcript_7882/g.13532 Transcript_7882/m.13532 type:complete len:144 (-) Transcript_7882:107-538(-)